MCIVRSVDRRSSKTTALAPAEHIARSILSLRGRRVLLDSDLAMLYRVETRRLNQQVRQYLERWKPVGQAEAEGLRASSLETLSFSNSPS